MRITRSQVQWQNIIEEQEISGLTIADYCRQHKISTTTFYACRKKFGSTQSTFVKATITQQVEVFSNSVPITLTISSATLTLPSTTSASYVAQLLREFI
jgi:putative transposase